MIQRAARSVLVVVAAAGLFIAVVAGASVASSTPPDGGSGGATAADYSISFVGCSYDAGGDQTTCTWTLTGTGDPASHIVIGGLCVAPVSGTYGSSGADPTTGLTGFKWEGNPAIGDVFTLVFDGEYPAGGTSAWAVKKGSGDGSVNLGTTGGPSCVTTPDPTSTPTPTPDPDPTPTPTPDPDPTPTPTPTPTPDPDPTPTPTPDPDPTPTPTPDPDPTPTPTDVCPNLADVQTGVPDGMEVDGQGNCVTRSSTPPPPPPPPPGQPNDACPNIAGTQTEVPGGMSLDANGNCVPPAPAPAVDVCPNIDGDQAQIPDGLIMQDGLCIEPAVDPAPAGPELCPDGTQMPDDGLCPSVLGVRFNRPKLRFPVLAADEVQPARVAAAGVLPFTGSGLEPIAALGLLLMGSGAALVAGARRARTRN